MLEIITPVVAAIGAKSACGVGGVTYCCSGTEGISRLEKIISLPAKM